MRERSAHLEVVHGVTEYAREHGFHVEDLTYSPIRGPEGNIEYLVHLKKKGSVDIEETVDAAFAALAKR